MNVDEGFMTEIRTSYYQCQSTKEFDTARNMARFSRVWSAIRGKNDGLLSLEDVRRIVGVDEESYVGVKSVGVDRIVGGEGRCHDFNRKFQPLNEALRWRWQRVNTAYHQGITLPPVKLFELGGVYFVRDGNHRVSVARAKRGTRFLDAEVTYLGTDVAIHPKMTKRDIEQLVDRRGDGHTNRRPMQHQPVYLRA